MTHEPNTPRDRPGSDVTAPDLTGPIMARLGYRLVSPAETRRRRIRRAAGRGLVLILLAGFVVVGLDGHARSDHARRPVGPTVPDALGEELEAHQERLHRVIRSIRSIQDRATPPAPVIDEVIDEDIDRSAIGPMRWI